MKILFLGYAVNLQEQSSYSGISVAGNKMQVNILKHLAEEKDVSLKSITILPYAPFPREKILFVKQRTIDIDQGISSEAIKFCNLPVLKQFSQTRNVFRQAKKMVDSDTIVLAFNLFPQVGIPLGKLKKRFGCKTCAVVADLPIDDNKDNNPVRKFLRGFFEKLTVKAFADCDKLIVVNKKAAEDYAPNTPYIVVEGGVDAELNDSFVQGKPVRKNIVYSGALSEYSGIMTLIDAMEYVNAGITLEIYGSGYLKDKVSELSESSRNIKYMGTVSNSEMIRIQQKAYLLVNPRPTDDPISMVTFPSKIFEYMLSGRPVLTTRLNGFSEEYLNHLYFFDSEDPEGFADAINHVFAFDETDVSKYASEARKFIIDSKNWKVQADRIIEFLNS